MLYIGGIMYLLITSCDPVVTLCDSLVTSCDIIKDIDVRGEEQDQIIYISKGYPPSRSTQDNHPG